MQSLSGDGLISAPDTNGGAFWLVVWGENYFQGTFTSFGGATLTVTNVMPGTVTGFNALTSGGKMVMLTTPTGPYKGATIYQIIQQMIAQDRKLATAKP